MARGLAAVLFASVAVREGSAAVQRSSGSTQVDDASENMANPIRKVVVMLQKMEAKIHEEGKKEEELYSKFKCYCKNGGANLGLSIDLANTKVPELQSGIREGIAKKAQLGAEVKDHQTNRHEAKEAIAKATAVREKEAASYAAESSVLKADISSLNGAIKAIASGMAGGFLQTKAGVKMATDIKKIALDGPSMTDADRQDLLSFLSGRQSSGYMPKSGEIDGILKTLKDDMDTNLASITTDENNDIASFEELMEAKNKEVAALSASIESKMTRIGELGVELAMQQHDLDDTINALGEDTKFLMNLKSDCETKAKEWEVRTALRADELVAISETIKVLNDDDSLELFKKTLPSAALLQTGIGAKGSGDARTRARDILVKAKPGPSGRVALDFVSMALQGKKGGFKKVVKMIDNMVSLLKKEQVEDDNKKEYCGFQLDTTEDKLKALQQGLSDHEAAIADAEEGIETVKSELKALHEGIKALDASVQDATETRQSEHAEYTELMANNNAAKEVLAWAKNRLAKFYSPSQYKAPPKRELAAVQETFDSFLPAFVQVASHNHRDDPGQAPETFEGDYKSKGQETGGVMAMIDLLVRDLDKELTEAETDEKLAQTEYEALMESSAHKRATDSKTITEKESLHAQLETAHETHVEGKASTTKDLLATGEYLQSLHAECDWLVKYFDTRKEARASEVEALGQAKAVLAGADFALLQQHAAPTGAQTNAQKLRR